MTFFNIPPALAGAVGMAGFALYVMNYTMLTLHLVCSRTVRYFALNLTAASCVMVALTASFNLPAAMIQAFFITISIGAIVILLRRLYRRRATQTQRPTSLRRSAGPCPTAMHSAGGYPKICPPDQGCGQRTGLRAKDHSPPVW